MQQLLNIAIAFDQLVNTLLGGMPDETISARAWRESKRSRKWKIAMNIIDKIFFWQKKHCYYSYLSEVNRKQFPSEYSNDNN